MNKKYLISKKNLIFADLCGAEFVMKVVIKKKTDTYIAEKEKKQTKEEKKKQEADELFNKLAQPKIKKKTDFSIDFCYNLS